MLFNLVMHLLEFSDKYQYVDSDIQRCYSELWLQALAVLPYWLRPAAVHDHTEEKQLGNLGQKSDRAGNKTKLAISWSTLTVTFVYKTAH